MNVRTDLAYAVTGDPFQKIDLYLPAKAGKPLVIMVHGGAWISGDKKDYAAVGERFAREGIGMAVVNYRLSVTSEIRSPSHVDDVAKAYDWLVKRAADYGYAADHIFLMGHSAGAHTIAMLSTGDFLTKAGLTAADMPKGFIGTEGIYDIPNLVKVWPSYQEWFIDKAFGEMGNWVSCSPTRLPPRISAPWMVIHSAGDKLVDMAQSSDFAEHLRHKGISVEFHGNAIGSHDEVSLNLNQEDNVLTKAILKFIRGLSK